MTSIFGQLTGTVRLNPGVYHYTFQCMLPPELPTSVEGYFGFIRYTVRVVLDFRPHIDTKFEQPFTLIKMINLNDDPALRVNHNYFIFIGLVSIFSPYF